ncbi:MAG: HD domain-containing phosphohydrolase, partial [Planctomycetota bacterium]
VGILGGARLSHLPPDCSLSRGRGCGPAARGPRGVETRPRTLRAARLAMAAGTVAGLPRERVNAIGTGCLLADIGSTPEDRRLEMLPRKLKPLEFFELTKRPSRAADILDRAPELGGEVRAVAFQIRERWDGSGYPRGRKGSQIHLLARLAMVADVYAALTSPRPWRKPYEPHAALRILLNETRSGKFDPVSVRIVIETLSLFPLGTLVTLDDGAIGRVVSSNFSDYTRPVLTLYDREHGVWVDEPIDLAGDDSREVVATFDGLEQALGESPEASAAELVEAADAL